MSPNLTSMAEEFDFDKEERDHFLGAELSLAYSVFSIPGAMALGLLADCGSRQKLFVIVVALGALATLCTAYVENYSPLFWLRVASGTATNAVIPIAFSFLGDLYPPDNRSLPSTLVTAAMGVGILVGQVLAGVVGPHMGWRAPFVIISLPGLGAGVLTCLYVSEPMRGQSENAVAEMLRGGGGEGGRVARKLDWGAFVAMLHIKTNILLILQALPGTIPWGVLFAYLNDFLSQEKGLPVEQATLLVSLFGVGSAVGGIGGGLVGQYTYKRNKRLLPVVMALSTILGVLPMLVLINSSYASTLYIFVVIVPCTFLAGILANINGTNVRPLLLNVNLPETRGSAVSVANLVANLGKGIGPSIANAWMERLGGSRQGAFNVTLSLWVLCGGLVFLLAFTLVGDELNVQEEMRRSTLVSRHPQKPLSVGLKGRKGHGYSGDEEELGLLPSPNGRDAIDLDDGSHHRGASAANGRHPHQRHHSHPQQQQQQQQHHHHPSTLLTIPVGISNGSSSEGPSSRDSPLLGGAALHHRALHAHSHAAGGVSGNGNGISIV
jgi:predicted MFS family arabinose efflux permease